LFGEQSSREWSASPGVSEIPTGDASTRLELHLLDGFELLFEGEAVWVPLSAQRLLAFLAIHDRPLRRVYVAGKLWPDTTEQRASANLRSTLWRAHQWGHQLIRAANSRLWLVDDLYVDLHRALARARSLLDGSAERVDLDFDILALAGHLLPDWYEDWLLLERERYRQLALHALEALAGRLIELGRSGEAAEAAVAAIVSDPLRESAHRSLIRVHLAERNSSEALRQYRLYRAMLREQLGLAPSDRMEALVRGLASG
jgi:DNA-binding SARP family transcriptional activator